MLEMFFSIFHYLPWLTLLCSHFLRRNFFGCIVISSSPCCNTAIAWPINFNCYTVRLCHTQSYNLNFPLFSHRCLEHSRLPILMQFVDRNKIPKVFMMSSKTIKLHNRISNFFQIFPENWFVEKSLHWNDYMVIKTNLIQNLQQRIRVLTKGEIFIRISNHNKCVVFCVEMLGK